MAELINELLGIRYPIIQGGMAWVATWELASAVSNAGGLGIIGVGGADVNWVAEQIRQMKLHTDKPFGVNLMLMNPQADEIDHFVLHQANSRIIESVAKRLRQPMEKFPMNLQDCGNISAASVPILLDSLNKGGKIQKNERIVLAGFGAGLTWGAAVIQW